MTMPMFPFSTSDNTINNPGHYKGIVCHSCPGTSPGHDIYIPSGWNLKSCVPISSAGGRGCAAHLYVALIEVTHDDYEGAASHPITFNSVPSGAQISVS